MKWETLKKDVLFPGLEALLRDLNYDKLNFLKGGDFASERITKCRYIIAPSNVGFTFPSARSLHEPSANVENLAE